MDTTLRTTSGAAERAASPDIAVSASVAGYGTAAAITVVFNTLLAWVKDAWDPLNNFMAALTGHHWITHGVVDVALFLVLGYVLTARRHGRAGDGVALAKWLVVASVGAGAALGAWFLLV